MSYSFSVQAATKAEARAAAEAKFDAEVIKPQPIHERDKAAVLANVDSALALLADDPNYDVVVSINGYVSWNAAGDQATVPLRTVAISCAASFTPR